jgi:hypothetical protein
MEEIAAGKVRITHPEEGVVQPVDTTPRTVGARETAELLRTPITAQLDEEEEALIASDLTDDVLDEPLDDTEAAEESEEIELGLDVDEDEDLDPDLLTEGDEDEVEEV